MIKPLRSIVLLVLLCTASVVLADAFYDAYQAGLAAFKGREYAKARTDFLRAYDLRPEPIVLYNIAQTYRLEANGKDALVYYRRFLAESKISDELRHEAEGYVADLEAQAKRAEDEKKRLELTAPKDSDGRPVNLTEPPLSRPGTVTTPVGTITSSKSGDDVRGERKSRIPLGSKLALGVAGAGLLGALVFTKLGLSAERDLETNPAASQSDADRVERYQNLINVSWGITGGAAISAVVIYIVAPRFATSRKTVVVAPTPNGAVASLIARF